MADKIKEVAVEEAERIASLASDAARSGAYLYPLRVSHAPGQFHSVALHSANVSVSFNRASFIFCPTGLYGSP